MSRARELFNSIGFPRNVVGNSYEQFLIWHNQLSNDDRNDLESLISEYFDIYQSNLYIKRRSDGATLCRGWNLYEVEHPLTFTQNHPYRSIDNIEEPFNRLVPFEFWDVPDGIIGRLNWTETAVKPVYISSIRHYEVLHFLLWYIYYKDRNISIYVGRYLLLQTIPNSRYNYYRPVIHGAFVDPGTPAIFNEETILHEYQRNASFPRKKPMVKKERTLRYLLRKIDDKWDELIKNEGAYTWLWFNQCLRECVSRRVDRNFDNNLLSNYFWEQIIKTLEKRTKKEWVFVNKTVGIFPKKMCKAYYSISQWNDDYPNEITAERITLIWVKASTWENFKTNNKILWDADDAMWYHSSCLVNVKYRNTTGTGAHTKQLLTNKSFFKKHERCNCCGYFLKKEEIQKDLDLDLTGCKFCYPKGLTAQANSKPSLQYCFGGYHSHQRDWKFFYQRTPKDDPRAFCVGMEVEMHNNNKKMQNEMGAKATAWKILQGQWAIDPDLNNCYFERDGSLSQGGLEMITNPMSLAYHQWYWTLMLPMIREHCVGWNTETFCGSNQNSNNYGIHMTFSRNWWTDLQLARLIKFVDNPENQNFIRAIAQRATIYNGGMLAQQQYRLSQTLTLKKGKIITGINRYVPVNVKGKLVELRFFRTTLNTESFLKNVEWIFAFYEWVKNTPFSTSHKDFLHWLVNNQRAAGMYSNLFRYFSRKSFSVKGIIPPKNEWKELFSGIIVRKPLVFPIEPAIRNTPENVLKGDIECV